MILRTLFALALGLAVALPAHGSDPIFGKPAPPATRPSPPAATREPAVTKPARRPAARPAGPPPLSPPVRRFETLLRQFAKDTRIFRKLTGTQLDALRPTLDARQARIWNIYVPQLNSAPDKFFPAYGRLINELQLTPIQHQVLGSAVPARDQVWIADFAKRLPATSTEIQRLVGSLTPAQKGEVQRIADRPEFNWLR